jgi:hypothetical protein
MSRIKDIEELLTEIDEITSTLSNSYDEAKKDRTILQISRVKVKSALEHLRSILDYCALDAYMHVYGEKPTKKLYFPYAKDEASFNKRITKDFTALRQKSPIIYDHIASVQPHKSGTNWLIDLCQFTNTNKHNNLTTQDRKSKDSVTIGNIIKMSGNCSNIVFSGTRVNGIPFGKGSSNTVRLSSTMTNEEIEAQLNSENPYIPVTRTVDELKFYIDGSDHDALAFIHNTNERISILVCQLYEEIDPLALSASKINHKALIH